MKLICGLILAVCVGIGCRWFGIPLPGPPAIMGAAMAVAMASGYTATDYWITRKSPTTSVLPASTTKMDEEKDARAVTVVPVHHDQETPG